MPEDSPHIADHRLGGHAAVSDDLGHPIPAIGFGHVVDDLIAPLHAEVDVEVGHRDTFGIEESFEQQFKFNRIQIGDLERIGHQGSCPGATTGPHRDPLAFRPLDEVCDNQEVAGEVHLVDDPDLEFQTLPVELGVLFERSRADRWFFGQPLVKPLPRDLGKIFSHGQTFGNRELRQKVLAEGQLEIAANRNPDGIGEGFGEVGKEFRHGGLTLQVLLLGVILGSPRILKDPSLMDANAGFVRFKL